MASKRSKATRRADSQAASARAAAIRREHERKERRRRSILVTVVGVVVLLVIVAVATAIRSSSGNSNGGGTAAPAGAVGGLAVPAGKSSAPVKVVIYEDYICPFCAQFEAASRSTLQDDIDAGKVQMQYHVLGFLDRNSTTKYSSRAANATAVVLDASGPVVAKKFHDLLYENQPEEGGPGLSDSQLVDYAVQAGAKRSKVEASIDHQKFAKWVAKVTDRASKAKVTATPTVRINGKSIQGSPAQIAAQVEQAVKAGS